MDVVWALRERKVDLDWVSFAITAWLIWNNRNSFKHEGKCKDAKRIAKEARELVKKCKKVRIQFRREWHRAATNGDLRRRGGIR